MSPFLQTAFIEIQTTSMTPLHLEASKNRKKEKNKIQLTNTIQISLCFAEKPLAEASFSLCGIIHFFCPARNFLKIKE